jgi:cell division protein FtsI (penicillin-binding protein 3)
MTMHERLVQWRMWCVGAVLLLAMVGLTGRLCFLHLSDLEPVSRPWEMKLLARRGTIYDRNGDSSPLAVGLTLHQPFIDPLAVKPKHDRRTIAAILSQQLNLELSRVGICFANTNSRHQLLPALVDDRVCRAIATNRLVSGVGWEDVAVREYPQGCRMANVIGFVNKEYEPQGGAGIEQHFNAYLKGINGRIEGEKDGRQIEIVDRRSAYIPPIDGSSIFLTLDNNIQYIVERELERVTQEFRTTGAWAIVERVDTGEILAMASWPTFDPKRYAEYGQMNWRNLPICVSYEPGSTMKSFTIAAGLNEGVITPETRMDVGRGTWLFAGHILHDHVEGVIDTGTALSKSSNIFCARVGALPLMLGEKRLRAYQRAFGFGDRLGIDLPGEERGMLRSGHWGDLATSRIAIGQGVAVTGLQMLNAYCCLANGGRLMKPYVVARIVDSQGTVLVDNRPQVIARPVRPDVAAAVCKMLVGVTEEGGTATRAKVINYDVAGKTGTAQIPENGAYSTTEYWASFVGFLPADKPVFGVLVVVERPHPQHMGGYVAAPVFANVADAVAKYLEVPANNVKPALDPVPPANLLPPAPPPRRPHATGRTP